MIKTTKQHIEYWRNRKIDWKTSYLDTWNHPHRDLIIDKLSKWIFGSVLEVGCASGPNLYRINKHWPGVEVGGVDPNPEAIEVARQHLNPRALLQVGTAEKLFLSNHSLDVTLTDMCLIYVSPLKIKQVMREIKRVSRKHVILCEFHCESWWKRQLLALSSGYYAHNYKKLLKEAGFHSVEVEKIPNKYWPKEDGTPADDLENQFRYIITARV